MTEGLPPLDTRPSTLTPPVSAAEAWLVGGAVAALAYPAWVRGGTYVPLQGPMLWLGAVPLAMLFLVPLAFRGERNAGATVAAQWRRLLGDPVFYLGLSFLALLLVQWWNAGRTEALDAAGQRWIYGPPRHPHLPSAIARGEAAEMLHWFFPAWTLILTVRSGLLRFRAIRLLLLLVALNAGALALAGLRNYGTGAFASGPETGFGGFASFGYPNHAAAFFSLTLLLALGLLLYELVGREERPRRRGRIALLGVAAALTLVGANLSLSRAGMLSWLAAFFVLVYGVGAAWPRLEAAARLHVVVVCVFAACVCFFVVDGFGKKALAAKAGKLIHLPLVEELAERGFQARAAYRVWKEEPWFGVGGWGYRYLVGSHVEPEYRHRLGAGKANAHNDPLQFLAEFGLVGSGLLAATVVTLLIPVARRGVWSRPLVLFPLLGIGLTFTHSLIDLPFRCPAILWHWVTILAALPLAVARQVDAQPQAERPLRSLRSSVQIPEEPTPRTPLDAGRAQR